MTYHPKSEFVSVMMERGFLADCTDYQGLDGALMSGVQPAYIGFDATAPSLHVGSLIQIMMLRWFQKTGHKPITLMGGGTTKVGDPTGKDASRKMLSDGSVPFLLFALLAPSLAPSLAHANALAHLTFPAPPCELPRGKSNSPQAIALRPGVGAAPCGSGCLCDSGCLCAYVTVVVCDSGGM